MANWSVHIVNCGLARNIARIIKGYGTCGKVIGELCYNLRASYVRRSARFDISLLPKSRIQKSGVEIPAVRERGLAALIGFITCVYPASRRFRMRVDMNNENILFSVQMIGKIDFKSAEHSLIRINPFSVYQHVVFIINTAAYEENTLILFFIVRKDGFVFPMVILEWYILLVIIRIIQVFKFMKNTKVVLNITRNGYGKPLLLCHPTISTAPNLIKSHI